MNLASVRIIKPILKLYNYYVAKNNWKFLFSGTFASLFVCEDCMMNFRRFRSNFFYFFAVEQPCRWGPRLWPQGRRKECRGVAFSAKCLAPWSLSLQPRGIYMARLRLVPFQNLDLRDEGCVIYI